MKDPALLVPDLLGRDALLEAIGALLCDRQNVLLFGPADVGKSALINALARPDVVVVDPFQRVNSHLAARIRRAICRGTVHLAAARSLDRRHLGAVRRIAFWFTPVQVPPLSNGWMKRLVTRECDRVGIPARVIASGWPKNVIRLARGRPGLAVATIQAAASILAAKGTLPSADVAFIQARIRSFDRSRNAAGAF